MIGKTITHFKILEKIGEGGMGVVYRAEDLKLKRQVAIKFLPRQVALQAEARQRFMIEAQAAAALNHPNIATIHTIEELPEQAFIVMEFVDGKELKTIVEEHRGSGRMMPLDKIIDYALQIAEGLLAAHQKNIVHRDIKTANLMVTAHDKIKVMDFGLAKMSGSAKLTQTNTTIGTAAYMSPEQTQGLPLDHRSDIWSFGVVLYEMLTGNLPFQGKYLQGMIFAILQEQPQPLQLYRRDLPRELIEVIEKTLQKSPENRFGSLAEVISILTRLRASVGPSRQPEPAESIPPVRGSRSTRRSGDETLPLDDVYRNKPSKRLLLLLAALLLGAGGYWSYNTFLSEKSPADALVALQDIKISQITTEGNVKKMTISPDGKRIAIVRDEQGRQGLWIRQSENSGSDINIMPPGTLHFDDLRFSADGEAIYYIARPAGGTSSNLYRLPTLGGISEEIYANISAPIAFSPDSTRIVFQRHFTARKKFVLVIGNLVDGSERQLFSLDAPDYFVSPAWSPDGRRIACFIGRPGGGLQYKLATISLEDPRLNYLSGRRFYWCHRLLWMPDGQRLLLSASADSSLGPVSNQIWLATYPGGEIDRITNDLANYTGLSLSGDGKIILSVKQEQPSDVWVFQKDNLNLGRRLSGGSAFFGGLSWTPDNGIVYASIESGQADIWRMNALGNNKQRLTAGPAIEQRPIVTSDGRYIVMVSNKGGSDNIWRMNIDGSELTQLTEQKFAFYPSCSPDGAAVVYATTDAGEWQLRKTGIDGGAAAILTVYESFLPAISPDGDRIAFIKPEQVSGGRKHFIALIPYSGGEIIDMFSIEYDNQTLLTWSPDGKSLLYTRTISGVSNIWRQPLSGGAPQQVTQFDSNFIYAFAWSADGEQLAVSRYRDSRDVIRIDLR